LGSIFSGNFNSRSDVPFLDQLTAISIADVRGIVAKDSPIVYVPYGSAIHPVRLMTIRAGIAEQLRFHCRACAGDARFCFLSMGLNVITVPAVIVFKANRQEVERNVEQERSLNKRNLIIVGRMERLHGDAGRLTDGFC
jgi:hypothetical protein